MNRQKVLGLVAGALMLLPFSAFAQTTTGDGGPIFNASSSNGYGGGKVTLCYQGSVRTVNANQAAKLIDLGATPGPCTPPGYLVITKTSLGADGTFGFYSHNGNLADFSIKTTGGTGKVTLTLAHGSYNIVEKTQKDWNQVSNSCAQVTITSGATTTCTIVNQAIIRPGSISGTVYNDLTGKGNTNAFQKLINARSGVTVYLDTNNNGKLDPGEQSQVTNAFGQYKFSNLTPNVTYTVREVVPAGYTLTYPPDKAYFEPIASGQNETYDDFANYLPTRQHHWWDNIL